MERKWNKTKPDIILSDPENGWWINVADSSTKEFNSLAIFTTKFTTK